MPEEFTDNPPLPEAEGNTQPDDTEPGGAPDTGPGETVEQTSQEDSQQDDAADVPKKETTTAAEPEA